MRLLVTGNPDWIVPAGFGERRFAVFDVGEKHMQDIPYFKAIVDEQNNGGREALLHYLLHFDLSRVKLREIPKTTALLEQIIETATPEQAWWFNTLKRGALPAGCAEARACPRSTLFRHYIRHAKLQGVARRAIEVKTACPSTSMSGQILRPRRKQTYEVHVRDRKYTDTGRVYRFPPLKSVPEDVYQGNAARGPLGRGRGVGKGGRLGGGLQPSPSTQEVGKFRREIGSKKSLILLGFPNLLYLPNL